jgi:murein DD-endopeptidase MepM/ murein hydrolase activator NlpD
MKTSSSLVRSLLFAGSIAVSAILAGGTSAFAGDKLPYDAGKSLSVSRELQYYNGKQTHAGYDFAPASGNPNNIQARSFRDGVIESVTLNEGSNNACKDGFGNLYFNNVSKQYISANAGFGNVVRIKHMVNGVAYYSKYAHLESISPNLPTNKGAVIPQGTVLGKIGNTGCSTDTHLHFEYGQNLTGGPGTGVAVTFDENINGPSQNSGTVAQPPTPTNSRRRPFADFNGDGRSEILYKHGTIIDTGFTDANGTLTQINRLIDIGTNEFLGVVDVNGDGKSEVLIRHSGNVVDVFKVNDQGQAISAIRNTATTNQYLGSADFNGDGRSEILYKHGTIIDTGFSDVNGTLTTVNRLIDIGNNEFLGVVDVNGDGKSEVLIRHSGGVVDVFKVNDQGTAVSAVRNTFTTNQYLGSADFNGDGRSELLYKHGTIIDTGFTDANGALTQVNRLIDIGSNEFLGIVDVNGDGKSEVLIRHSGGIVDVFKVNDQGVAQGTGIIRNTVTPNTILKPKHLQF